MNPWRDLRRRVDDLPGALCQAPQPKSTGPWHKGLYKIFAALSTRGSDHAISILIMTTPPLVGRCLRPSRWRILPLLLSSERRQVEQDEAADEDFNASGIGKVGLENSIVLSKEDTQSEGFALRSRESEIVIEIRPGRGKPWNTPSHPPLVRLEICQRGARDQNQGSVASVQVRNGTQMVHHH